MEDLENHRTVKIEGWALARRWALAQDNMVTTICCKLYSVLQTVYNKLAYLIHTHAYCSVLSTWQGL